MRRMVLAVSAAAILGLAAYVANALLAIPQPYHTASPTAVYPLLSWEEYRTAAHGAEPPVIREAEGEVGALLFFGAEHSNDPGHPQVARLEAAFSRFGPSVVLVEGRPGPIFRPFMDPVSSYGESGALLDLAHNAGVRAFIWELPREDEPRLLLQRFTQEQVAIYLLMRPFPGGANTGEAEAALAAIIEDRGDRPGIENVIGSVDQFDAVWRRNFPSGEDWRDLNGIHGAPGFLGEMFEYGNDIRVQHLLNIVGELMADGERVMVTMGWSHTVRLEPAIAVLAPRSE